MDLTRRSVLGASVSGAFASLSGLGFASGGAKRQLRIAYLTDIHLASIPEVAARASKALKRASKADVIFFGGDNLMAIDNKPAEDVETQFKYWREFIANLKKPYHCILGNHDIEQWQKSDETILNGKRRAIQLFNMPDRYWSIEINGWRFIGLDTVQRDKERFKGEIDAEQAKWLEAELAKSNLPTVMMGHMPILSVTALAGSRMAPVDGALKISNGSHVENGSAIAKIVRKANTVKLALSGHTHMIDRCDFGGTSYMCAGAVCGGWWNGANEGFGPTLFEFDLMSDGTFISKPVAWED
jgi:3',5'-cyclic-AMP phosphodiesterase